VKLPQLARKRKSFCRRLRGPPATQIAHNFA
jgi:hypothetical protein